MADFYDPSGEVTVRRHKLPHWKQKDVWISLTYRLADSLPEALLCKWREERDLWLTAHPLPWDEVTEEAYHERFSARIEH